MKPMTFIVCAAGGGLRMRAVSEKIPKPLLLLNHKTLLTWSIESLNLQVNDQLIIVHRFDFEIEHIRDKLILNYPNVAIHFLNCYT